MKRTRKRKKDDRRLASGKLPLDLLQRMLNRYAATGNGVLVGPSVGVDAAALRFGSGILLAKTDPITFVAEDIGTYAVHINANDIAVMGGRPRWFLACVLLPEKSATPALAESIFNGLHRACRSLEISLCGGHTEVTPGLDRPIVIGQMLGEVSQRDLITSAGARVGDVLILTKGIAIEAASILARERKREIVKVFGSRFADRCRRLVQKPGISIRKDAGIALRVGGVHALHDPTEGGVATGLYEMAIASGVGLLIDAERIPILPEFSALCDYFEINPYGAIASGSLLISARPAKAESIRTGLAKAGIIARLIGRVTKRSMGMKWMQAGKKRNFGPFETDEIARRLGE